MIEIKNEEELNFEGLKDALIKEIEILKEKGEIKNDYQLQKTLKENFKGDYRFDLFSVENQDKIIKDAILKAKEEK